MEKPFAPIAVFYSCSDSPTDAPLLEQLERHLSALQHEGVIATWHKRQILAGSLRQVELDRHLNTAALILLLVSSDFLASDYCYGTEMQRALQRHEAGEAQVIPILLRSCLWQSAPFAALEVLPTGAQPITMWHDRDAAWTDVVRGIRNALQELLNDGEKKETLVSNKPQPLQAPKKATRSLATGTDLSAPPSSDVIILTALPEEFQAAVAHLQGTQEVIHPQTGTIYQQGAFPGKQGIWRVAVAQIGMGGLHAATETERASNLFHPRLMLFVGIAGGLKDVRHGDVVIATKVYAYESGKAAAQFKPRPEVWHANYALEQRARVEANNDEWLAHLDGRRPNPAPRILLGPIAAGEKVVADQRSGVYRFLQAMYSDSLAVEMEGHGFMQALDAHPHTYALVIRGISDLIDDKAEVDNLGWQEIAARHAAAFAFRVLATFTLPGDKTSSSSHSRPARFGAPFPEIWNVFRRHTPFFTGRSQVLEQLFEGFQSENEGRMIWPQVITGLGGMGKTQTAAEYAYRFRENYRFVLWVRAETRENLFADFRTIAKMLKLPQEQLQDRTNLVQATKEWFRDQSDWLLIFDNADNPALVDPFLPRAARGHLLLTTRAGAMIEQAQPLQLQPLEPEDGALCLLRRAGLLAWNKPLQDASAASVDAAHQLTQLMDGLPLALEQAGAYINDTACGVKKYLYLYQQYRAEIQRLHHGTVPDYPESVASAWSISRSVVEQSNPAAAELLRLCAFWAPEAIPDELLTKGASTLGPVLGPVAANPVVLDQAIRLLRSYSLLHREADRETDLTRLSIHRVLQEILLDEMDGPTQRLWAERAICAVAQAFPTMSWQVVQAHARNCLRFIKQWQMSLPEADFIQQRVEEYSRKEEP